jgi:hypothetical protein
MPDARFDPRTAVTFDLVHGLVAVGDATAHVVVPAGALGVLCGAAGAEATVAFGRALGEAIGTRVASRLRTREAARAAAVEEVLEALGAEVAVTGLGSLSIERWGQALVLVVDHAPALGPHADELAAALLEAALRALTGRDARVGLLGREGGRARFLVASAAAIARVRAALAAGRGWGEALVALHGGPDDRAEREERP